MREDTEGLSTNNNTANGQKTTNGEDQKVAFHKLFTFADRLDVALMIVGTLSAIANGLAQPLMTLIFGQLINSFGAGDRSNIVKEVSKVALKFCVLGSWIGHRFSFTGFLLDGYWRKTVYPHSRMSGDTILIQDAMGEKVGKFIQLLATFFGGFAIGFIKGWLLALVLLSSIPPLVIAGGAMALIMTKMSSRGQVAYAEAGNIVEQTVGAIRTVASFTGEKHAIEKYNSKLKIAYNSAAQQGFGLRLGTRYNVVHCIWHLCTGHMVWIQIDRRERL
ncbi:hypothetical protein OIU84_024747 [Salix udensis]|uniref:ABC transmembrane type-1 domain-containing protein n=1 Tax=Salix udensis TaxID=889485 RepID=A0AAD6KHY3_9ROSI|nr:hypothetical protein OIU84_024747 [Salix udensis]